MKYESAILKRLIDTHGVVGNPHYISEIIKEFIVQGKECYPDLFTYQSDWLAHIDEFGLNPSYTVSYTGQSIYAPNTLEKPVKRAILKGSTKYRDIDTGEVLDVFEDGRNLEIVSVKMPVLSTFGKNIFSDNLLNGNQVKENGKYKVGTSNSKNDKFVISNIDGKKQYTITISCTTDSWTNFYIKYTNGEGKQYAIGNKTSYIITTNTPPYEIDYMCSWGSSDSLLYDIQIEEGDVATSFEPYKSNILTVNEDVTLRSNGDVYDELNLLTGRLTQRIVENNEVLSQEVVKAVDLTILDQNGQNVKQLMSFNGGTHFNTMSMEGSPLPMVSVSVETDLEETLKVCSLEGNTL